MREKNRINEGDLWIHPRECLFVMDQLNVGALVVGLDRRISALNESLRSMLDLNGRDVAGRDCRDVFLGFPCDSECPLKLVRRDEKDVSSLEIPNRLGKPRHVIRLSFPLRNLSGNPTGCLALFQDHSPFTTLVNRLNYEERSLKAILNHLDIGIFTVNRGGYLTFFNSAAERISGYDRRQVLGKPACKLFCLERRQGKNRIQKVMESGVPRTGVVTQIKAEDEEMVPVRADFIPLKNESGVVMGALVTMKDLTIVQQLDEVMCKRHSFQGVIGKDPAMRLVLDMAAVMADSSATLLIEGATGTGKDLLAKAIHYAGERKDKPFVKVNCAAIPETLLESELFGYVKGAFSGANHDKSGRFQEADGGTIFLDEIGDLPPAMQAKLLRVLDDKEFYPLGSQHTVRVDVRVISATNRGLEQLVARRIFREDLFYRLNVLRIELPPLNKRRADLPLLIRHFMRKYGALGEVRQIDLSPEAMEILMNYSYPGNVRELENIVEHCLAVCREDTILPEHLHAGMMKRSCDFTGLLPADAPGIDKAVDRRNDLLKTLRRNGWHRENTARELGINRTTLWRKMKKYGLLSSDRLQHH